MPTINCLQCGEPMNSRHSTGMHSKCKREYREELKKMTAFIDSIVVRKPKVRRPPAR